MKRMKMMSAKVRHHSVLYTCTATCNPWLSFVAFHITRHFLCMLTCILYEGMYVAAYLYTIISLWHSVVNSLNFCSKLCKFLFHWLLQNVGHPQPHHCPDTSEWDIYPRSSLRCWWLANWSRWAYMYIVELIMNDNWYQDLRAIVQKYVCVNSLLLNVLVLFETAFNQWFWKVLESTLNLLHRLKGLWQSNLINSSNRCWTHQVQFLLVALTIWIHSFVAAVVIHGGWGDWYASGECSVSCGVGGVRRFERRCDNPRPQNGGEPCRGDDFKHEPCNTHCCPGACQECECI